MKLQIRKVFSLRNFVVLGVVVLVAFASMWWSRWKKHHFVDEVRDVGGSYQSNEVVIWPTWRNLTTGNMSQILAQRQIPLVLRMHSPGLYFYGTDIDDQWVVRNAEQIKQIPSLELVFRKTKIGDVAIEALRGGTMIHQLDLNRTNVTDDSISAVASLSSLRELDLSQTQITDDFLSVIATMPSLNKLNLSQTQITDASISAISSMTWLQILDLSNTQITDKALPMITVLPNLSSLDLSETEVTDWGLAEIGSMASLDFIDLRNTKVTAAGIAELIRQTHSKGKTLSLQIDADDFTTEVVSALNDLVKPDSVALCCWTLWLFDATDSHVEHLCNLRNPYFHLTVQGSELTERSLTIASELSPFQFRSITFRGTKFSSEAIDAANQNRTYSEIRQEKSRGPDFHWKEIMSTK